MIKNHVGLAIGAMLLSAQILAATEKISLHDLPSDQILNLYKSAGGTASTGRKAMIDFIISKSKNPSPTIISSANLNDQRNEILKIQSPPPMKRSNIPATPLEGIMTPAKLAPQLFADCDPSQTIVKPLHRNKRVIGYAYHYKCSGGDVFARSMSLAGIKHRSILETSNITIGSTPGYLYETRDDKGFSFTRLTWTTDTVHHLIDKEGSKLETEKWLMNYASKI